MNRWAMVVSALGWLTACRENLPDNSKNKLPSDAAASEVAGGDAGLAGDVSATADSCNCLKKGTWYRFDKLAVATLDGGDHPIVDTMNALWAGDIKKHELNFYLEIVDVVGDEFQMRIVNGARLDAAGTTCTLKTTESVVTMKRTGCLAKNAAKTGLNVYAGTPANPKNCTTGLAVPHSIPVRNAVFEATFSNDCSSVVQGLLVEGSIAKSALDNTCTCPTFGEALSEECGVPEAGFVGYNSDKNEKGKPPTFCTECCKGCNAKFQNLNEFLDTFGALKYGCKDEKGDKAVCLTAIFTAVPTQPISPCK